MGHLGELLHQRRTSLGLTLTDLQNRTKIRGKYLEAIEQGDFDAIPGEVYLRGFIRSMAGELGIDPGEAMQAYYQDLGQQARQPEQPPANEEMRAAPKEVVPPAPRQVAPAEPRKEVPKVAPRAHEASQKPRATRSQSQTKPSFLPLAVVAGLVIALVGGFWYWSTYLKQPPVVEPPIVNQPGGVVNEPPVDPVVKVVLQNPGEQSPVYLVKPGPLELTLTVSDGGSCWVNVTADDRPAQATMLDSKNQATRSLTVQANQQILVRAGYPRVLHLLINGEDQGALSGESPRNIAIRVNPAP